MFLLIFAQILLFLAFVFTARARQRTISDHALHDPLTFILLGVIIICCALWFCTHAWETPQLVIVLSMFFSYLFLARSRVSAILHILFLFIGLGASIYIYINRRLVGVAAIQLALLAVFVGLYYDRKLPPIYSCSAEYLTLSLVLLALVKE